MDALHGVRTRVYKKTAPKTPIQWRALIRKTVAVLSIIGYDNVFGRDIEGMNVNVASAAWIALLKTLPRLAECPLPPLPTVDELRTVFRLKKSLAYLIGTYVIGTDEATAELAFLERIHGRKYTLRDETATFTMLAKLYDLAHFTPPVVGTLCYHEEQQEGVTRGITNSATSVGIPSHDADTVDVLMQLRNVSMPVPVTVKRRRVEEGDDPSLRRSLFTRPPN